MVGILRVASVTDRNRCLWKVVLMCFIFITILHDIYYDNLMTTLLEKLHCFYIRIKSRCHKINQIWWKSKTERESVLYNHTK